jgi:hypothetical protein
MSVPYEPYAPTPSLIEEMVRTVGPFGLLCWALAALKAWFLFRFNARWIRESVHRNGRDPILRYWELHRPEIRDAIWNDRDLRGAATALGCLLLVLSLGKAWCLMGGSP